MKTFSSRERRWAIVLLALSAYWPTLKLGFLWDDHVMIESNSALRTWSWTNVKHDFSNDAFNGHGDAYYRPIQTLANRVDFTLWGLRPFGYHLTNLAFHTGSSVLTSELALAIGLSPLAALLAGGFFAVHPIGVEQLIIIAGRAELMSMFFMLASLLAFLRSGKRGLASGMLFYALALLSKESAVVEPALYLLILWYMREEKSHRAALWIFAGVTLPYLLVRQMAVGAIPLHHLASETFVFYLMAFPRILTLYAVRLLIPWNLHSHHLISHLSHYWMIYLLGWIGLATACIVKKCRLEAFCLFWFILTFLPKTPSMILGGFMLDHWAYPAMIALGLLLAKGFESLWVHRRSVWNYYASMSLFPLLICWALLTHLNVALRGTDEKMYRWALHFTSSNPIKHNLGVLLLTTGRPAEAIPLLEEVNAVYPEDVQNDFALALAYWHAGHPKSAERILQELLTAHPDFKPAADLLQHISLPGSTNLKKR